ncbi:nudC domain-containing protein 3-like [Paramacrobiotus metropolitanus]|uniref:nudC domain-containing protein 3-like n=1 Tax=Paramacrobiotus metropolitanus TaxID=2943436 RepID=UPI002445DAE6|nr:nudC domain-containing protein 3-like [Paramacrobiotus metropolitanus]XP_055343433.1 nudC domain-containing protein 3-like [Paramacrobiotus metropolitanus]
MSHGKLALYDETLSGILNNEGQIAPFLDVIFGFLYRKTDFFHSLSPDGKSGFLPGTAENLVKNSFQRYDRMAHREKSPSSSAPPAANPTIKIHTEHGVTSPETGETRSIPTITAQHADDPGNGAVHDKYSWNQTLHDLDVKIHVPKSVTKSKQLNVELTGTHVRISVKDTGDILLEGPFHRPINSAESMWILVPAEYIQMTLEKITEEWWNCLIEGQGKIDLEHINAEVSFQDMKTDEQQLVRKMIHDQQAKAQGKPTSDQVHLAETLKTGWNADGSPFKNLPYDANALFNLPAKT